MSHTDQSSLADIYQLLYRDCIQQTSYILHFHWRDLTSDFDTVGPYFTCSKTMESKFVLLSCVYETIKLFYMHGLNTFLIVCNGASSNLSVIKATHGHFGVYPILKSMLQSARQIYDILINSALQASKIL